MKKIYSVRATDDLLVKDICRQKAKEIVEGGYIDGMTENQVAREIYFHARAYRFCSKRRGKGMRLFDWVRERANPIDLADYGDTLIRRAIYALCWLLPGKKK